MALKDLLTDARRHRTEITVHAPEPWPGLADHLGSRNVTVRHEATPPGESDEYITVHREGVLCGAVSLAAVGRFEEPTVAALDDAGDELFSHLVSMLDETVFRSLDRRQLLATSREFEDRAWRQGEGTLHAGFQRAEALRVQRRTYEHLAGSEGLDVHVYTADSWVDDPIPGLSHHVADVAELRDTWFVVYDGGDDQACALVAAERADGTYEGCWTYESDRVASLHDHLRTTYW